MADNSPQWGVFDSKQKPVAVWDSFGDVEYRASAHVANHPMERGAFSSYNKVQMPYAVRIGLACSTNRKDFLEALETAQRSLDLYSVVTPDATYLNANIEAFDYRRTSEQGAWLILAELSIREIRQVPAAQFAPKSDSAQPPKNSGSIDPAQLTPAQTSTFSGQWTGDYKVIF